MMMAECLHLAAKGGGYVSPNPMVGAVLVKNNRVVSRGYHRKFGGPHAEVECLRRYRGNVRGATLYVNLEPCCHLGKTPPCTDLIISSGLKRVVVAMQDANPIVQGKGIRKLRKAGITVDVGVMEVEAQRLNRMFITSIAQKRPYIHVKIAQTLDGKIAPLNRKTTLISSHESRTLVHQWRGQHDAVLVGAGTIVGDNPLLDTRLFPGRDPVVIILDGEFNLPVGSRILRSARRRSVYVAADSNYVTTKKKKAERFHKMSIMVLGCKSQRGKIRLRTLFDKLYEHGIASILVEGGSSVFTQCLEEGLIDQLSIFTAPHLMGAGLPAFQMSRKPSAKKFLLIKETRFVQVGSDNLMQAFF